MSKTPQIKDGHAFVQNRRALFEFEVIERLEAGLILMGSEVKSIRDGKCSLNEAYCQFNSRGELFLVQAHIGEYPMAHSRNHVPLRQRKLLLHERELLHLVDAVQQKGLTLIPLDMHAKNGRIKLALALVRGKKDYDKRASIKEREQKREIHRAIREHK
nr:SsrA-binding protein SmpB [Nannocystis sp.]